VVRGVWRGSVCCADQRRDLCDCVGGSCAFAVGRVHDGLVLGLDCVVVLLAVLQGHIGQDVQPCSSLCSC